MEGGALMRAGVSWLLVAVFVFLLAAPPEARADCMPTGTITTVEANPFTVTIAVSHKWINAAEASTGVGAAFCEAVDIWYVQVACAAAAASLAIWIQQDDHGYGVFVSFYPLWGGWSVSSADSICPAPPPPVAPTCSSCCEWSYREVGGKIVSTCTRCLPKGGACP
jgi:hypothetical protein